LRTFATLQITAPTKNILTITPGNVSRNVAVANPASSYAIKAAGRKLGSGLPSQARIFIPAASNFSQVFTLRR